MHETLASLADVGFHARVEAVQVLRVVRRSLVALTCISVALTTGCGSSTPLTTGYSLMQTSTVNDPTSSPVVTEAARGSAVIPTKADNSEPESTDLAAAPTITTTTQSTPASGMADPPADSTEGVVREGRAAMKVVLEPGEISPGQQIRLRLSNRGEVDLLTGLSFEVDRWDGRRWISAWGRGRAWAAIALEVRPGGSTKPQAWPGRDDDYELKPGWYRIAKSAAYDEDRSLLGKTRFRVQPAP